MHAMKYLYISLLFLLISCGTKQDSNNKEENNILTYSDSIPLYTGEEQPEEDSDNGYVYINVDMDSTIIRIRPDNSTGFKTEKITMLPISKEEYEKHEPTYIEKDSLLIQDSDSSFSFKVKEEVWNFKKEPKHEYGKTRANKRWSEYIGYYPDLKLHAVRSCSVSGDLHGFAHVYIIEEETASIYYIVNGGDYADGTPVFSPNNKYMAMSDNTWDEDKGWMNFFTIFKVNENPSLLFSYFNESDVFDFSPQEIIWIDDNEFVIKGYIQKWIDDQNIEEFVYYKLLLL